MADETIENEDQIADEQVTDQVEETVVESTESQTQDDPLKLSPESQSRYKSAADLETFAKQKQGEADRLRSELETYKQQHPTPQPITPTEEEQLERFAKDPVRFIREISQGDTNDIRARVALSEFTRLHPDIEEHKEGMKEIVNRTPGILADPEGLEMAYLLAKSQGEATKLTQAAAVKQAHNAQVTTDKQTTAVVEGTTIPKPASSPKVVPGMSIKESTAALKAAGIRDGTDDDRID